MDWRVLFDAIDQLILILDKDQRILEVNEATLRLFGVDRDQLVGKPCFEVMHGPGAEGAADGCPMIRCLASGKVESKDMHVELFGKPFFVSCTPLFDETGQLDRVIHMATDVSALKSTQEALQSRGELLGGLLKSLPIGVTVWDARGNLLQANDAFVKITGYSLEDVPTLEAWFTRVYPDPEYRVQVQSAWDGDSSREGVTRVFKIACRDGRFRDIEFQPVFLRDGRSIVTMNDVTERVRADEALRASEERFRALIEDVQKVAVQGYDKNRRVIFWNRASELLYGYSREEALGGQLEDLIIPDFMREDVIELVRKSVENGEQIPAGELELLRKDGSLVSVFSSHVSKFSPAGEMELFCIDVDLTEMKKANQALELAKQKAEAANRAKSEFLANMSHEIRTPLNGIMGMLQLLKETRLDTRQQEYADTAIQSSRRLTRLLSDILDLAQVEAGKLPVRSEQFNLGEIIRQTCELFMPASKESGIRLFCRTNEDIPELIVGDALRLQQVFSNLLGNALKYTLNGQVSIEASPLPRLDRGQCRVLFTVSDTGIGIPDDKQDVLFQPFSQAAEGYRRSYQGAGLGLSICKRLVELMRGSLAIDSEQGKGTTIYASIPFKLVRKASYASEIEERDEVLSDRLKVLVAEDDMVSRMVAQKQLEKAGCLVTTVENGWQALEILKENTFDVVLMDVQMPVMDGVETTRAIREGEAGKDRAGIPVIAFTAFAMTGDRERLLEQGMDGYVSKPIEAGAIARELQRVLCLR